MKKIISLIAISVLITSIVLLNPVSAQSNPDKFVPNRLLVKFKEDVNPSDKIKIVENIGGKIVDDIPKIDVKILKIPDNAVEKVKTALSNNPMVEYVEYDKLYATQMIPNDEWYYNQWYLEKLNLPAAWDSTTGDPNVIIAILDTGVDITHPDLQDRLLPGFNAYNQSAGFVDACNHGTRVAGVAAASSNNMIGVAGIAGNVKILPIIVANEYCYGSDSTFSKGLIYSAEHGAKIANLSFGPLMDSQTLVDSAKYFTDNGGLVVTAAGNTATYGFYGNSPYIINVSATDENDLISTSSSYGPSVDFSAPGKYIRTTKVGGYAVVSGTSFSAPVVSGIIGLVYSINPSLTPDQVFEILKESSNDLGETGYDISYGWGRVDADKAVQLAKNFKIDNPPTVPIAPILSSTGNNSVAIDISWSNTDSTVTGYTYQWSNDNFTSVIGNQSVDSGTNSATITNLSASTQYNIRVYATNSIGNSAFSNMISITTSGLPPTVSITNPDNGQQISGTTKVIVDISDTNYVSNVELYIDDNSVGILNSSPFEFVINSASYSDGTHVFIASASTKDFKVKSNPVQVAINNSGDQSDTTPLSVSIINPIDNSSIKGKITVSVKSNVPVNKVEVYIDSTLKKVLNGSLIYQLNTKGISNGDHVISVKAFDSLGRTDTDSVLVNIIN